MPGTMGSFPFPRDVGLKYGFMLPQVFTATFIRLVQNEQMVLTERWGGGWKMFIAFINIAPVRSWDGEWRDGSLWLQDT